MTFWLLLRGLGERPLGRRIDPESIRTQSSSKRPSIEPGDQAILYASVWQAIFGVAEIVGEPEHDPSRDRWAWTFPIRPVDVITDLERAPAVEEAGVFPQSLWRHSHVRLTTEQFERASELIKAAA
jgi:EVE domain